MMMRRYTFPALLILALAVAIVAGCDQKVNKISSILQNPDKYMDKEVTVAGHVTKVKSVQLFIAEPGIYQVDDGSGTIWVITRNGVPREGAQVGLKGTLGSPIRLFGDHFGAVIRENERRIR